MRVRVYLRTKTVYILVARRNMTLAELAGRLRVSPTYLSLTLNGKSQMGPELRRRLMDVFKGSSVKKGGRLCWDDLFQSSVAETAASL